MNRYPFWKYLIIVFALLFGTLYTLPNFFGEVPAVQISPLRQTGKVDEALTQRVKGMLAQAQLQYDDIIIDANSLKVRFKDTETQLKAKDILQTQLGQDYVAAFNLLSSSPAWLRKLGALPMYLGLDLRGGVYFLLQVDMKAAVDKAMERYAGDIRAALRDKKILYSGIARQTQAVQIGFRTAEAREQALKEISRALPDLTLKEREEGGQFFIAATLSQPTQKRIQDFALQQNINTLRNRVNELGVAEPIIQQQGADRVVVQLPGVQDTAKAKEILGRTATLEIRMADFSDADVMAATQGQIPFGAELYYERNGQPVLVRKAVILTGDRLTDAQPGFDQQTNEPAVHLTLDGRGARIFKDVTRENVGKRMAILLIEKGKGEVVTAPVIRDEIGGGRVQISGRMSTEEAKDISLLLRAGALAAPMEIIEERTVGPSMGADNIAKGFNSNIIGFAAIAAFMIFYYRMFGVISTLALAANVLFLVAILSSLQATLTLPGMAGIALTVGMAIDANVLINERIREELRNGNSPQAAIHAGYDRAFGTILDSNVTTFIAGLALFLLGSGPVKGFAVVLCLGILTSMFSAVFVSRGMVNLFYGRRAKLEKLSV